MTQQIPNFGQCWSTPQGQDLSSPASMVSGFQAVAEAILRRWTTGPGELIDDPTYGSNVQDLLGDDLSPADIVEAQRAAAAQAQADERVQSATVQLSLNSASQVLTVTALIVTGQGPFRLVASISAVSVQLLLVQP